MAAIAIRPCRAADLAAVTAIYHHAVVHGTGSFELEPPDQTEMEARFARLAAAGYPALVACDGAEVIGYAYAGAYRDRPAYRFTVEDSIYLHPDHQGRGVGRALLDRLLAAAEASGYRQMVAVVGDSANRGSIRLHEAAGFTHLGVLRSCGWKGDRWLDVVFMQRALGSGDRLPPV